MDKITEKTAHTLRRKAQYRLDCIRKLQDELADIEGDYEEQIGQPLLNRSRTALAPLDSGATSMVGSD